VEDEAVMDKDNGNEVIALAEVDEVRAERIMEVYRLLMQAYGPRHWWPAKTPFEMMVGAILTQNTTWANVEKAIANLGEKLSPEYLAQVPLEELGLLIRSSGYYNQKAVRLKALTAWYGKYAYDVEKVRQRDGEELRSELLALKGIGRETADSILVYALDKPYFVIDAYTKRIFGRLGYTVPKTYDELRLFIEQHIPRDLTIYQEYHALLVELAKRACLKVPSCAECPLESLCLQQGL
jgi:endonuclease-3 related protein